MINNIFKQLIEKKIPYAVGIERVSLAFNKKDKDGGNIKIASKDYSSYKYFLVIFKHHRTKLSDFVFNNHEYPKLGISVYSMDSIESQLFRTNIHKYNEVQNDENGKVFELKKGVSFKKRHKTLYKKKVT